MARSPYDFVQSESSWWRRVILPTILVGIIAFAAVIFVNERRKQWAANELNAHGVKTDGWLDNGFTASTKYQRTEYLLTYTFHIDNETYAGSSTVDQRPSNRNVVITYLPSDPNVNRLEDPHLSYGSHFWSDIAVGLGTAAGVGLVSWLFNSFFGIFRRRRA